MFGGEIWTAGGVDNRTPVRETAFRRTAGERCDTLSSDVPWLSLSAGSVPVAAGGESVVSVRVDAAGLPVGTHRATVLVRTDDPGAPQLRVPVEVTVTGGTDLLVAASAKSRVVGGVAAEPEDVVSINTATSRGSLELDGSDVGLAGKVIDALDVLPDGSWLLSFADPGTVPGIDGTVDDSDLLTFTPTALGGSTAGTFTVYLDGDDVSRWPAPNVNSGSLGDIGFDADGRIWLAAARIWWPANGPALTTAYVGAFTPTSLGERTAGSMETPYLLGSSAGLGFSDHITALAVP